MYILTISSLFTLAVWVTELFIYYFISQSFGEEWSDESYFLIAGMFILFYGMSIYNAPNAGSILLKGKWYSFGIDCSQEYEAIRREKGEVHAKSDKNLLTHKNTSLTVADSTSGSNGSSDLSDLVVSLLEYEPIPEYEYEPRLG